MDWLSYFFQVNWLAVLLAFAASMAIRFVWYLPAVLGKRWMEAGFASRPAAVTLIDSGHDVLAVTAAGVISGAMS